MANDMMEVHGQVMAKKKYLWKPNHKINFDHKVFSKEQFKIL